MNTELLRIETEITKMKEYLLILLFALGVILILNCTENPEEVSDNTQRTGSKYIKINDEDVPYTTISNYEIYPDSIRSVPGKSKYNPIDNLIYSPDFRNCFFAVYDENMKLLYEFGEKGQGPGEFSNIGDYTFDEDNNIYVIDTYQWRINILDSKRKYLSSFRFENIRFFEGFIRIDPENNIVLSDPRSGKLFSVLDKSGNTKYQFGELLKEFEDKKIQYGFNELRFEIDKNNNLYYAFRNTPLIRKYDSERKLIFEIDIAEMKETKDRLAEWEKKKKKPQAYPSSQAEWDKLHNVAKGIIWDFSVDSNYFYVLHVRPLFEKTVISKFDIISGELLEKLLFDNDNYAGYSLDCTHSDFVIMNTVPMKKEVLSATIKIMK